MPSHNDFDAADRFCVRLASLVCCGQRGKQAGVSLKPVHLAFDLRAPKASVVIGEHESVSVTVDRLHPSRGNGMIQLVGGGIHPKRPEWKIVILSDKSAGYHETETRNGSGDSYDFAGHMESGFTWHDM